MREFQKEVIAVATGKTKHEACETIRHSLVYCMRCGDRFVIYVDKTSPDFKNEYNFEPDHWPSKDIFDFENWRKDDSYMKIVHADENHDML